MNSKWYRCRISMQGIELNKLAEFKHLGTEVQVYERCGRGKEESSGGLE